MVAYCVTFAGGTGIFTRGDDPGCPVKEPGTFSCLPTALSYSLLPSTHMIFQVSSAFVLLSRVPFFKGLRCLISAMGITMCVCSEGRTLPSTLFGSPSSSGFCAYPGTTRALLFLTLQKWLSLQGPDQCCSGKSVFIKGFYLPQVLCIALRICGGNAETFGAFSGTQRGSPASS